MLNNIAIAKWLIFKPLYFLIIDKKNIRTFNLSFQKKILLIYKSKIIKYKIIK